MIVSTPSNLKHILFPINYYHNEIYLGTNKRYEESRKDTLLPAHDNIYQQTNFFSAYYIYT